MNAVQENYEDLAAATFLRGIEENLSAVVRTVRKHRSLKQSEIAAKMNVNQSTYSKIERQMISTSIENWLYFAHKLGLNVDAPMVGFVDLGIECEYDMPIQTNFSIPPLYLERRLISNRFTYQFLDYLRINGFSDQINQHFERIGLDADYLRLAHGSMNIHFYADLLRSLGINQLNFSIVDFTNKVQLEKFGTSTRGLPEKLFSPHFFSAHIEIHTKEHDDACIILTKILKTYQSKKN